MSLLLPLLVTLGRPFRLHGQCQLTWEDERDIFVVDEVFHSSEAASAALLNRNRKIVILSLGARAGRQEWSILWLRAINLGKAFGVIYHLSFVDTVEASWFLLASCTEKVLQAWAACLLFANSWSPMSTLLLKFLLKSPSACPMLLGTLYGGAGWRGRQLKSCISLSLRAPYKAQLSRRGRTLF